MGLGKKLSDGLEDIRGLEGGGVRTIEVREDGYKAKLRATEVGKLAVLCDMVEVRKDSPAPGPADMGGAMAAQAAAINRKISYLTERFRVVEFDREDSILQMRSSEPLHSNGERHFYELMLHGGSTAVLRRYKSIDGAPGRVGVSADLTMNVLERLVDDMADALGSRY